MVSSFESAPTPTIRSMNIRLPVTTPCAPSRPSLSSTSAFFTSRSDPPAGLCGGVADLPGLTVGLPRRRAGQLREDEHDAVHRGMGRPDVDVQVLGALAASGPRPQEQLARVGHQASLRSAIILISAR